MSVACTFILSFSAPSFPPHRITIARRDAAVGSVITSARCGVFLLAALHFSCSQVLYGVTTTRVLVTVNTTTAAVTPVCTFSTTDLLRVIAFLDATRLMHFVGSSTPTMELLSLSNPGSVQCSTVAVSAYRATASSLFQGAPVVAAQQDTTRGGSTGLSPRVLVVAGSPSSLYSVSAQGAITLVATVVKATDVSPLSPYALAHTRVKPVGECDSGGKRLSSCVGAICASVCLCVAVSVGVAIAVVLLIMCSVLLLPAPISAVDDDDGAADAPALPMTTATSRPAAVAIDGASTVEDDGSAASLSGSQSSDSGEGGADVGADGTSQKQSESRQQASVVVGTVAAAAAAVVVMLTVAIVARVARRRALQVTLVERVTDTSGRGATTMSSVSDMGVHVASTSMSRTARGASGTAGSGRRATTGVGMGTGMGAGSGSVDESSARTSLGGRPGKKRRPRKSRQSVKPGSAAGAAHPRHSL